MDKFRIEVDEDALIRGVRRASFIAVGIFMLALVVAAVLISIESLSGPRPEICIGEWLVIIALGGPFMFYALRAIRITKGD